MKTQTLIALSTASCLALSGCLGSDTLGQSGTKATNGAILGAVAGGIAGLSQNDDKLGKAVLGAAIGGAIGGTVGTQLDRQAADLQADLGNDDVTIVNTGSELVVTLPQDILFATDSAVVRSGLQSDLRTLAANLQEYQNTTVQVIGHTDNTGAAAYNQDLSSRRATAVATILTSSGVSYSRVQTYGRGEDSPVATNLSAEGRAQNRRVEIIITPTTSS
jgi:outer membrane protein OmpA-like peptidoglycan-associated protein